MPKLVRPAALTERVLRRAGGAFLGIFRRAHDKEEVSQELQLAVCDDVESFTTMSNSMWQALYNVRFGTPLGRHPRDGGVWQSGRGQEARRRPLFTTHDIVLLPEAAICRVEVEVGEPDTPGRCSPPPSPRPVFYIYVE